MTPEQHSLIESARASELKTHAVEFAKWVKVEKWFYSSKLDNWIKLGVVPVIELNDNELYTLFNPKV